MKVRLILVCAFAAAAGISCGGNSAPPDKPASRQELRPAANTSATPSTGAASDMPTIPKDARWTVFCAAMGGPNHAGRARELRTRLINATGMRDFYVVTSAEQSTLYYGFYKAIDEKQDKREAERAQTDRKRLAALADPSTGGRMFRAVLLVNLEEPDPSAPAEWDLARARGFWSVQIGIFKDIPDRKVRAIEAVREARAMGYEAYYFHGPTASSVCIGAWPEEAVVKVSEARARNPNAVPLLMPGASATPHGMTTPDGRPVEVVQERVEIASAALANTMKEFPVQAMNGVEARLVKNTQTGAVREVRTPSVLVRIPHTEGTRIALPPSADPGLLSAPPGQAAQPTTAPPPNPWTTERRTAPQGGRLKGLED